jgi:DNA polymerase alpha subunit A
MKTGEPVTCRHVYEELQSAIFPKHGITTYRVQEKELGYAFDLDDVPDVATYLVVRYPAKFGELPPGLTGNTFSHVFAAKTSILENFLVQNKFKGPFWVRVYETKPSPVPFTWCKLEVSVRCKPYFRRNCLRNTAKRTNQETF